jgi:hypothetical protein
MKDPKVCTHPEEHLIKVNGDLKACEFCGTQFIYKAGVWVMVEPKKK